MRRVVVDMQNALFADAIAMAIDAKDEYTGGHSERVGQYTAILALCMILERSVLQIPFLINRDD